MTRLPMLSSTRVARLFACGILALAGAACSDEATTPDCPDLPLYDVSNPAALTPDVIQARSRAVNANCMTAIAAPAGTGGGGSGGSGATGGSDGRAR